MKNKVLSILFVILAVAVMVGAFYEIMSYATHLLQGIVDFITTNDFNKLKSCGVTPPESFSRLKAEFATLILPFIYWGLPLTFIFVAVLMFFSGYYHRKSQEPQHPRPEDREMVHKVVQKMENEKTPKPQKG